MATNKVVETYTGGAGAAFSFAAPAGAISALFSSPNPFTLACYVQRNGAAPAVQIIGISNLRRLECNAGFQFTVGQGSDGGDPWLPFMTTTFVVPASVYTYLMGIAPATTGGNDLSAYQASDSAIFTAVGGSRSNGFPPLTVTDPASGFSQYDGYTVAWFAFWSSWTLSAAERESIRVNGPLSVPTKLVLCIANGRDYGPYALPITLSGTYTVGGPPPNTNLGGTSSDVDIFFRDTFAGTAGTTLPIHNPLWELVTDVNFTLDGVGAAVCADAGFYITRYGGTPPENSYYAAAIMQQPTGVANAGIGVRGSATQTSGIYDMYYALFLGTFLRIYRRVGGGQTLLGTVDAPASWTNREPTTLVVQIEGDPATGTQVLSVYLNGSLSPVFSSAVQSLGTDRGRPILYATVEPGEFDSALFLEYWAGTSYTNPQVPNIWFTDEFDGPINETLPQHNPVWQPSPVVLTVPVLTGGGSAYNPTTGEQAWADCTSPPPGTSCYASAVFTAPAGQFTTSGVRVRVNGQQQYLFQVYIPSTGLPLLGIWEFNTIWTILDSTNTPPASYVAGQPTKLTLQVEGDPSTGEKQTLKAYVNDDVAPTFTVTNLTPMSTVRGVTGFRLDRTGLSTDAAYASSFEAGTIYYPYTPPNEPGEAISTTPIANGIAGDYRVIASSPGLNSITFELRNGTTPIDTTTNTTLLEEMP